MRVRRQCALLLALALGLSITACNRGRSVQAARENQPAVSPAEQDFMMKASEANHAEIETSRMAMQKTDNTDVRDYANMIQSDHSAALRDLTDLMRDKNVSQPKSASADARKDMDRMNRLTGPEFDREFVNMMVMDHQKTVEMFRDQEAIVQNPDVKKYVEDVLPQLEMHLEKAQRLQSKLFSGAATRLNR